MPLGTTGLGRPGANEVWLIRHGETEWSRSGRHTGRTDVPLTPTGERQGLALGRHIAGRRFTLVLTSPLARARETCRLAGYGAVAAATDDLREWDYGLYEGRRTDEIRREVPGWSIWTAGVPGGETVDQVGLRARRVIDRALAADGDVALFALGTGAVSVLGYERETRVIGVWNQDRHLVREEADR